MKAAELEFKRLEGELKQALIEDKKPSRLIIGEAGRFCQSTKNKTYRHELEKLLRYCRE